MDNNPRNGIKLSFSCDDSLIEQKQAKARARQTKRRSVETPEEAELRKQKDRERKRARRQRGTIEQQEQGKAKECELNQRHQHETIEQQEQGKAEDCEPTQHCCQTETIHQGQQRKTKDLVSHEQKRAKARARQAKRRSIETPEEAELRKQKDRERKRARRLRGTIKQQQQGYCVPNKAGRESLDFEDMLSVEPSMEADLEGPEPATQCTLNSERIEDSVMEVPSESICNESALLNHKRKKGKKTVAGELRYYREFKIKQRQERCEGYKERKAAIEKRDALLDELLSLMKNK